MARVPNGRKWRPNFEKKEKYVEKFMSKGNMKKMLIHIKQMEYGISKRKRRV